MVDAIGKVMLRRLLLLLLLLLVVVVVIVVVMVVVILGCLIFLVSRPDVIRHTHTLGRILLKERSARHRGRYTNNT